MLKIEVIGKESKDYKVGKVGHKVKITGSIADISLEFYFLARHIVRVLDEHEMGYLFKHFVKDLLPDLLDTDGDLRSVANAIAKATEAMEQDGGNDA